MIKTMLTSATQQRNSQGNLQGNPQSETPPISIETSPIAPIIDAARIFSLRFTARMKRISALLIMSVLMVSLAACGGGGGGGDVVPPGEDKKTGDPISVSNLRVFPDVSSAILMWDNPDADIQHIDIMYTTGAAANLETRYRVTDPSKIVRAEKNVTQIISGLTATNYTFNIHLELKGSNENKPVEAVSITRLIGPNLDGDEYADDDPLDPDSGGGNDGGNGGGGGGGGDPITTPTKFTVIELEATPGNMKVTLSWTNPAAQIANISINYGITNSADQIDPIIITNSTQLIAGDSVEQVIPDLTNGQSYTFNVTLALNGTDAGKEGAVQSVNATPAPITQPLTTGISISNLRVFPDETSATLMWDNPDADIQHIDIIYTSDAAANVESRFRVIDPSKIVRAEKNVTQIISGLTSANYTFRVALELGGADEGKSVMARERTLLIGPNLDGDEYADAEDVDDDNDGVNDLQDAFPRNDALSAFAVSGLRVIPDESNATLIWNNPDAVIANISISYKLSTAANFEAPISPITDDARIAANATDVMGMIPVGLLTTPNTNYTFSVTLELKGADENKSVIAAEITRLIGPNLDGDEYADTDPLELDIDGDDVNNTMDAFPSDPTESMDTDDDRVGDNADNCPLAMNNGQNDFDNDVVGDACDIDYNGNGLIEIATAQQLNQSRHNLLGSNFTRSAGGVGDTNGCGNGGSVTECNGYELIADISLATYANWQPIGRCTNSASDCTPVNKLFNAIFDGNNHTINDLTITNHDGSYDNAAGLFGAISSDSILRNIHIRSGNISDGGRNVGLLVGYAAGAMIINSSAEGAVNASGGNVGGLVGYGLRSTITSSYAAGVAVSGTRSVGGLVGAGGIVTITSSYAAGGAVSGTGNNVGGLVGRGFSSTITSSYAAGGDVSGRGGDVGGLVGDGAGSTITSSYAAGGDVSGAGNNVGGLVGYGLRSTIMSSYAAGGAVSGDGNNVGGLVGRGFGSTITSSYAAGGAISGDGGEVGGLVGGGGATITFSYWDSNKSGQESSDGGEAKTTSELQAPVYATGIYATWTSSCPGTNKPAWYFGNSTQYPVLTCHPNSDSDRDGVPDILDTDDDNDGTLDTADAFPLNPTESEDTDNDGVGDNTDAFPDNRAESVDTDNDGVGDNTDAFPSDPNESVDTDGDGVGDNTDNCPLAMNNGQDDFDNDVVGDACDVDYNGNGLIEIATAQQLNQSRHNLLGSSFKSSAGGVDDANGCGNGRSVTACNGYELIADIYLAAYTNWQPIGRCPTLSFGSFGSCDDLDALFNAFFDGNNHTINDLTITNHDSSYANAAGLFGAISGDSILRNIHIRSGNISDGGRNVGLLVGYAEGAMIINSSAEGTVNASGDNVGGLIGDGARARITSSYAAGGSVSGRDNVGGLVGVGYNANITSSYASGGDVSGRDYVGGLVGFGDEAIITSSYAVGGSVSGTGDNVGGLVGLGGSAEITSSYAAGGAVSGDFNVGGLVGFGLDAEITSSYAAGGDISGLSDVGGLVGDGEDATITSSYAAGGAVSGPSSSDNVGGLVGDGDGATITSSYAAGGTVSGANDVGGLVGDGDGATITSSYAAGGDVSGSYGVGGLVGFGEIVHITSSYAAGGTVSGANDVGGLVGIGDIVHITSSYAAGGNVSGDDNVGGLVGYGGAARITSSYTAGGDVSGANYVGGLVGNGDADITSSYAAGGDVSGDSNVGGLVGGGLSATITFSYWDSEKSGQTSSFGGGDAKTTEELKAGADGIYSTWASGTCADGTTLVWEFGTASEYPALRCTPNGLPAQEHLRQR